MSQRLIKMFADLFSWYVSTPTKGRMFQRIRRIAAGAGAALMAINYLLNVGRALYAGTQRQPPGTTRRQTNDIRSAVHRYCKFLDWRQFTPQPNRRLSHRNDKNTGWIMRNVQGYLAYVGDNVGVLT